MEMKGTKYMTISMTEDEVIEIEYDYRCAIDILNDCSAEIYVSAKEDFTESLKIPNKCSYNGFMSHFDNKNKVYIKSIGTGDVSIAVQMV